MVSLGHSGPPERPSEPQPAPEAAPPAADLPKAAPDPGAELARLTTPYVSAARSHRSLAELIESFGIRLRRADRDVARDPRWLQEMADGPNEGRSILQVVGEAYARIRRENRPQRPLTPYEQALLGRSAKPEPRPTEEPPPKERPSALPDPEPPPQSGPERDSGPGL